MNIAHCFCFVNTQMQIYFKKSYYSGNYLTYQDVQTDKGHVYNISVSTFRGLIMELLDILF